MIIVTGIRRSGTSLTMHILRQAGVPIAGYKYPFKISVTNAPELYGGSMLPTHAMFTEHNPNGFWEIMPDCAKGLTIDYPDSIAIKIALDALPNSKPKLIDKTILVLRNPLESAYSNSKCYLNTYNPELIQHLLKIFTWHYILALEYLKKLRKPIHILKFESLISTPEKTIQDLLSFVGRGDTHYAQKCLDPKLYRIKQNYTELDSKTLEVYNAICKLDYSILKKYKPEKETYQIIKDKTQEKIVSLLNYSTSIIKL